MKTVGIVAIIALALGLLVFAMMFLGDGKHTERTLPVQDTHRLIVVFLDDTGSNPYYQTEVEKAISIALGLNPDDRLYVILIDNEVIEQKNLVVRPNSKYIATLKGFQAGMSYCPDIVPYRNDYVEQLKSLKFTGCRGTDIYGAFRYASLIFADETRRDKYLVVFSDLGDTTGRKELISQINLTGVTVNCLYFPTDLIKEENQQYKPDPYFWDDTILSWGASSVKIYNHVQSDEVDPLEK